MQEAFARKLNKYFPLLLLVAIAANATGLCNDILEPDGALYASIAKHIAIKNDWINLYAYGTDWLDKPHLPFWLAAASFKVFGVNSFAYKLPSFLCFLLAVLYTYKFSAKLFSKQTAQLATLIYATSLHVILSNFDVRAEAYLTAFIIASMYHFYCAMQSHWLKSIVAAALYAALAIMTKGIFVLITIASGFVVYWIASKQWKQFIQPKWYLLLLLIGVFILPELYCLYQQFDLHPEKLVFEKHNISGIKFFFWDSQFGRFFNNGPIQGSGDIFFFTHTTIWAFLPWSLYVLMLVFYKIKSIKHYKISPSIIVYASAFITFLMFSVSKFQLPHYIVIIFPLLSMVVAKYLVEIYNVKILMIVSFIQSFTFIILLVFIALIAAFFKLDNFIVTTIFTILSVVIYFVINKNKTHFSVVLKALSFSVLLALFLNIIFYPQAMQYQAGMMAGKWQKRNLPNTIIPMYKANVFSFEFYGNSQMKREDDMHNLLKTYKGNATIFAQQSELIKLNKDSFSVKTLQSFPYFHISEMEASFFNYKTRPQVLDTFLIAEISKKY